MTSTKEVVCDYQIKSGWKIQPHLIEKPNREPSQTVPDDSYEIKDLIKKYAAGLDPAVTLLSNYGGDDTEVDHDDIDLAAASRGDFVEVDEHKKRAQQLSDENKARLEEYEQKKREAQQKSDPEREAKTKKMTSEKLSHQDDEDEAEARSRERKIPVDEKSRKYKKGGETDQ